MYTLTFRGKIERHAGHWFAMRAFLGSPPEGYEGNHIDGDQDNNRLSNLEYVTKSGNQQHAIRVLGHIGGTLCRKLPRETAKQIRQIWANTVQKMKVEFAKEMASMHNVTAGSIHNLLNGSTYVCENSITGPVVRTTDPSAL